jgi:ADP-ribose pyrophosphatase YjhB (NUDIX family)
MTFNIAVKAFIVEKGHLLILRRSHNVSHMKGIWEIPGGRLNEDEDIIQGLKREVKEETNLDIEVKNPLSVKQFIREDGQDIVMITFLAHAKTDSLKISDEHLEHKWVDLDKEELEIERYFDDGFYMKEVNEYRNYFINSG